MEPCAGRHVEVEICTTHAVQTPKDWHGVEHDALQVDGEIEHQNGDGDPSPPGSTTSSNRPSTALLVQHREPTAAMGNDETKDHGVRATRSRLLGQRPSVEHRTRRGAATSQIAITMRAPRTAEPYCGLDARNEVRHPAPL